MVRQRIPLCISSPDSFLFAFAAITMMPALSGAVHFPESVTMNTRPTEAQDSPAHGPSSLPPLRDRDHAARLLARRLAGLHGRCPLVLGLPGAGVHMGRHIADALDGELDVVLARTLAAPDNPGFQIGALDEAGRVYLNVTARHFCSDDRHVRYEASRQRGGLEAVRHLYRAVREQADPAGRIVIVVDDGLGCAQTMLAALAAVRGLGPAWLVAAVGVATGRTCERFMRVADQVECLERVRRDLDVQAVFSDCPRISDADAAAVLAHR